MLPRHDYGLNFDSSQYDTLILNAQFLHENLAAGTPPSPPLHLALPPLNLALPPLNRKTTSPRILSPIAPPATTNGTSLMSLYVSLHSHST